VLAKSAEECWDAPSCVLVDLRNSSDAAGNTSNVTVAHDACRC